MNSESKERVYGVSLVFRYCRGLPNVESVMLIAHHLAQSGLQPARVIAPGTIQVAPNIDELVMAQYVDRTINDNVIGGQLRNVGFALEMETFTQERARCVLTWMEFEDDYIQMTLGGWIVAIPQEHRPYKEAFAEILLTTATKLYPLVRPEYGFIAASYTDRHPLGQHLFVKKRRIPTLSWVDFFGPEYVAHHGRDVLAGIPGWRVEDLADGGLKYQSRKNCVVTDMVAHRRWQKQATAYLAQHGISIRFDYPAD